MALKRILGCAFTLLGLLTFIIIFLDYRNTIPTQWGALFFGALRGIIFFVCGVGLIKNVKTKINH